MIGPYTVEDAEGRGHRQKNNRKGEEEKRGETCAPAKFRQKGGRTTGTISKDPGSSRSATLTSERALRSGGFP